MLMPSGHSSPLQYICMTRFNLDAKQVNSQLNFFNHLVLPASPMTDAQRNFLNQLLHTLGLRDEKFNETYLKSIAYNFIKLKKLSEGSENPVDTLIDFFKAEIQLKKLKEFKLRNQTNYISATDIANFTYCPVNFAISRTFDFQRSTLAKIGSDQHNMHYLINYLRPFKVKVPPDSLNEMESEYEDQLSFDSYENEVNREFVDKLKDSELIFTGHGETSNKTFFVGRKNNYAAQPDYIFRNKTTRQYFAVEEKFFFDQDAHSYFFAKRSYNRGQRYVEKNEYSATYQYVSERRKPFFFQNHQNQLRSYLYGIPKYELSFGYLVYWHYILVGYPIIVGFDVHMISRTPQERETIANLFREIEEVVNEGTGKFDPSRLNANKCGSCVSNLLCGHKTAKYKTYTVPYSDAFLKL
jgi:hypothetical protein